MDEVRAFQVYRPDDYDISNARYPVLIVLDGIENFQHASATADFLAEAGKIPAMLVVGIPNTDRDRDMDSAIAPGSSPFLKFITDELVPRIERDYRTHPHRVLVGHSGGGLFALYSMVNAPEVFRGYIVIAPAFGDNRELPKTVDTFLQEHPDPYLNSDVFLTADNSRGMGLSGAWELSSHLQDRASRVRDLRFTFRRYDDTHSAVPMLSVYEGLQSIFEGWQLDGDQAFALYDQGGLTAIDKHYAALSTRLGFPVAVPEDVLTGIFTSLEGLKRFAEAEQVVNKAIESFPTSPTPVYYAGRLYMQMGNNPLAVETLQKSLQLSPNYGPSVGLLRYMKVEVDGLVQEVRSTGADLARYVGRYGTSAVVFEIEQREDRLFGRTSQGEYALEPVSTTTFAYSGHTTYSSGGTVTFLIDERGRVTGLEFQGGGARLAKLR
jgi:predicted alpha/beta superfamily hydrolase